MGDPMGLMQLPLQRHIFSVIAWKIQQNGRLYAREICYVLQYGNSTTNATQRVTDIVLLGILFN